MESIKSLLCLAVFGWFTFILLCLVLPPYWLFKFSSFIVRSLFPENVKGKVVLITGASSGIGEHVAYEYAKRGARLALVARRKDRLVKVAEKAREFGSPDVLVVSADVSKPENCEKMIQETITHFETLDHLVNNAGIASFKLLEEYTNKEMESIMNTNFWSSIHNTRYAIPHLRRSKGKIVAISSVGSWSPTPRLNIYNASKSAMTSLFESLRVELEGDVKITLVNPGLIESEMTTVVRDNLTTHHDVNEPHVEDCWKMWLKNSRFFTAKVEGCAKMIVKSACRGDRELTVPKCWILAYYVKLLCPQLLEFPMRLVLILINLSNNLPTVTNGE